MVLAKGGHILQLGSKGWYGSFLVAGKTVSYLSALEAKL